MAITRSGYMAQALAQSMASALTASHVKIGAEIYQASGTVELGSRDITKCYMLTGIKTGDVRYIKASTYTLTTSPLPPDETVLVGSKSYHVTYPYGSQVPVFVDEARVAQVWYTPVLT